MRTVEYEPGWGWIARNPDGTEAVPNFRWASRSIARSVAKEDVAMRAARYALGLRRLELYAHPDDWSAIQQFAIKLQMQRAVSVWIVRPGPKPIQALE